ncbi:hypothetical protein A3Q56_04344 [Intoshia linei]|uniref:PPM-type phosphatase domain-containing protein n=1 Tax=Intoshia linei TaxID=1819745 RepID=A0A177B2V1_9BILA|nr:hypothetical protein A3Q56_04344 [Intoshia linei]
MGNIGETERARVMCDGGRIEESNGVYRVNEVLAVTRSIGDYGLKPIVSNIPDHKKYTLTGSEFFMINASDGFWEYVEKQVIVASVYRMYFEYNNVIYDDELYINHSYLNFKKSEYDCEYCKINVTGNKIDEAKNPHKMFNKFYNQPNNFQNFAKLLPRKLIKLAVDNGSKDNISIIVEICLCNQLKLSLNDQNCIYLIALSNSLH